MRPTRGAVPSPAVDRNRGPKILRESRVNPSCVCGQPSQLPGRGDYVPRLSCTFLPHFVPVIDSVPRVDVHPHYLRTASARVDDHVPYMVPEHIDSPMLKRLAVTGDQTRKYSQPNTDEDAM